MKFWQELRRRRVFRLAGLYIIGAWVVIQVADISFQAWGVPESALRYLFIAAFVSFPVALIFSWYYDITPKGIVRTEAVDDSESFDLSLKRKDYILLSALLGIGLLVLLGSVSKIQEQIEEAPDVANQAEVPDNSIAVLPFANLDINPETGYFSDGITEEILDRLSSLKALHVLASNSSFAFRDSKEGPTQILEKLGVRYLLQGSIRREQNNVRVTARLIDEKGFQVWSDQFDRQLEGIFAIQTEIASSVASQIINEIVPLQDLPEGRTTTNMEAYNEYLVGKAFLDSRTENWNEQATASFRKAIELDPGFAPPYAGLAMAITVNTHLGPHWEEGRQLAEKAIALDTDFAGGHAALGMMLMADGKLQQSSLSSRRALELNPSLGFAYNILAATLERLDQHEEATAVRRKGLAVDPLNPPLVANIAGTESDAGNFDRAEQLLQRLLYLPKPPPLAYSGLYFLYDHWGRFADAVAIAKQTVRLSVASGDTAGMDWLAWAYGNLGMTEDADYWMEQEFNDGKLDVSTLGTARNLLRTRGADSELGASLHQLVNHIGFKPGEDHPWELCQFGLVNIHMGDYEKGAYQLDYGLRLYQADPRKGQTEADSSIDIAAIQASPDDIAFLMHLLAFAYQQVGQDDEAQEILQALSDAYGMESNALHQIMMGNTAGALQIMQPGHWNDWTSDYGPGKYYEITNDPAWSEAIKTPEFQALLAEMKEDVDRQRSIVEAIDAEHDFRSEIGQLTAK